MCRNLDFRIGGRSVALAPIKLERKKLYGWTDKPTLPQNFKGYILWMLYSDNAYKSSNRYTLDDYTKWIVTFPRSRYLILPSIGSK